MRQFLTPKLLFIAGACLVGASAVPDTASSADQSAPDAKAREQASAEVATTQPPAGQLTTQPPASDEARAASRRARVERLHKARARTRPKAQTKAVGEKAAGIHRAQVNWVQLREEVATTERNRLAASRIVTHVPPRPPGIGGGSSPNMSGAIREQVDRVTLPVLVPDHHAISSSLRVFGQPNAYMATAEIEPGVLLRIAGSRSHNVIGQTRRLRQRMRSLRKTKTPLPVIGSSYIISRSDSSTDLSFARYGCGYVLSLICDDPDHAMCSGDEFITTLAGSMVALNDKRGQE